MTRLTFNENTVVTTVCTGSGREIFYQTATGDPKDQNWRYLSDDEEAAFKAYRADHPEQEFARLEMEGH